MSRYSTPLLAVLLSLTTTLVACSGMEGDPSQTDPTLHEEDGDKADSISGKACGGIAGLTCASGYTCNLDGNSPGAGTCVKVKNDPCAKVQWCAAGTHCELKSTYGTAVTVCVKDQPSLTCASVKCAGGTHCEMKGINGRALPVCLSN